MSCSNKESKAKVMLWGAICSHVLIGAHNTRIDDGILVQVKNVIVVGALEN